MDENLSIVNPFDDVSLPADNPGSAVFQTSQTALSNLTTLSVGSGSTVMHADYTGFWLGAATFAKAPFSVSMAGVITSKSVVSGNTITIDGGNGRIVCNDGTTNRVAIGNV